MDYAMLCKKREQLKELYEQMPKEALQSFKKSFEIEYTHNSTAIEGNTLSLVQTKAVLEDGLSVGGKTLDENVIIDIHPFEDGNGRRFKTVCQYDS